MAWLGALCLALLCGEASHAQAPMRLRAWNIHPDGYPVTEAMKGFAAQVTRATQGRYQIEVFSNARWGPAQGRADAQER